jgi:hypothetical protein
MGGSANGCELFTEDYRLGPWAERLRAAGWHVAAGCFAQSP